MHWESYEDHLSGKPGFSYSMDFNCTDAESCWEFGVKELQMLRGAGPTWPSLDKCFQKLKTKQNKNNKINKPSNNSFAWFKSNGFKSSLVNLKNKKCCFNKS